MKTIHIIFLYNILFASCAFHEADWNTYDNEAKNIGQMITTFKTDIPDFSVSVFQFERDDFYYKKTLTSNWQENGYLSTQLPIGKYKFLFCKNGMHSPSYPLLEVGISKFSDIYFTSVSQVDSPDIILPVDEIFLQETKADSIYDLAQNTKIQATLKRAVAQVIVRVREGELVNGKFYPLPSGISHNLMQHINHMEMVVQGVGRKIDYKCDAYGEGVIFYERSVISADSIDENGITFIGPYFFPSEDKNVQIGITLSPYSYSPMTTLHFYTTATPQRNEKVIITVWITKGWHAVDVSAETKPISKNIPGESGFWNDDIIKL